MDKIEKYMNMMGLEAEDKVTKVKGVITSLSFDLYGCIQVTLTPKVKKDGDRADSYWYDVNRINILKSKKRVMDVPDFEDGPVAEGKKGGFDKPTI